MRILCLSCGDTVCRACAAIIDDICPTCSEKFIAEQLCPSRVSQRQVKQMQCHCPNRGLGCDAVVGVLDVEHHLGAECEWREEECDQCHQQVRRAEMASHKDTTCTAKPSFSMGASVCVQMACGYADLGCPTNCPQCDLAAHERDGVVAHMGLLRQRLADTSADLVQTKAQLTATAGELIATKADLVQTRTELAQTRVDLSQTQHDLAAVRLQINQLFITPAAPEGLAARWDEATKEVALDWQPAPGICAGAAVGDPAAACCALAAADPPPPGPPVHYRVQATIVADGHSSSSLVYMGPDCHCRYRFPQYAAEARFVAVAMRGLVESSPATATCIHPGWLVFTYDHDMDERGLFYYIGTQGRTQPWRNPAEAGWVTATRSPEFDGKASDLTGRRPCDSSTEDEPNSWWQVDLGAERLFSPTRYTLRHNDNPEDVELRLQSWRLEGSVDGADGSWRTLDEHTNEPNAIPARDDAMATFAVAPERAFPARRFRVLMTGPSPNGYHYLILAGLEMYGSLRDSAHQ
ncbi:putative E3 ubiquitin-protein ligase HECTD1 [Paratrimastix pyriformis]|uniref:E3 ubiquitin-protein ligase HECTD1 n=1 Tax=Paratrimastix pyriformis TaxID=342808 RepID=A0ABQ8UJQ2_9EUKA|nr:putative E3 ubiquitin-protein ligase HECTD1 [Paratrimastix pyriformis]